MWANAHFGVERFGITIPHLTPIARRTRRAVLSVAVAATGVVAVAPFVGSSPATAAGPAGDFPAGPPPTAQLPGAARISARALSGSSRTTTRSRSRPERRRRSVAASLLDRLGVESIEVDTLSIHTPDLDDVLFALTSQPTRQESTLRALTPTP